MLTAARKGVNATYHITDVLESTRHYTTQSRRNPMATPVDVTVWHDYT